MAPCTLVVGEALIDRVHPAGGVAEHVGGSPANVAMGLGRLGHRVDLATHIGRDAHGATVVEQLDRSGVGLAPGSDRALRTPTSTATLDAQGGAEYTFALSWQAPDLAEVTAGHLHTGSLAAALEPGASDLLALLTRARGQATTSYDPNVRPSLMGTADEARDRVEQFVTLSDVVKASDEDLAWLYADTPVPEVLRRWGALGPAVLVLTLGAQGAVLALPATGEVVSLAGPEVEVVDTVGAGDSFMAGLLSGLLDAGLLGGAAARERLHRATLADVRPAVDRALATAAWTVARPGADAPCRADLTSDQTRIAPRPSATGHRFRDDAPSDTPGPGT